MPDRRFFEHTGPLSLADLASLSGIAVDPAHAGLEIYRAAPLVRSDERSVSFFADRRYLADLKACKAAAVFVAKAFADAVPEGVVAIVTGEPQAAWARAAAKLHPAKRLNNAVTVDPTAELEDGVVVAAGAVIGAHVRVGRGALIGAHTAVGPGVSIGRDCVIGSQVVIGFALVGDRVHVASGAVVGELGFGVAPSAAGAIDVPQLGRVIVQDGVTIGANSCVDRGAFDDTVIGENSKIDNLVQIAHNVVLGRNCVVAGHCGISGSARIGDGVMLGGRVGVADHVSIGDGARVAGAAGLMRDVPAGETWAGIPARPIRQWFRETAWLAKQAAGRDEGEME